MFYSILFYLVVYIGLLLFLSWIISRKQKSEDFLIAGRNRRGWQILLSKFAGTMGAGYFITYTGFAYEYGVGVFAMLFGIIAGFLIFAYWASPRIADGSKEGKFYTIGHFVYSRLKDKRARISADVFSSIILFGWLLVGIIGAAKIIEDFDLLSYNLAVILTALVVLFYLILAGYRAVILTDIIQSFVILILMFVVTFGIIGGGGFIELHSFAVSGIDIGTAVAFFFFGVLAVFSSSDRYQLSYAAKNKKELKHGLGFAVIPIIIVAYFLLLIGVFMATKVSGLDSGLVFTEALKVFLSPSLVPLAVILFFAGVMSSADTNIYAISSHYALSRKDEGNYVHKTKEAMIGLTIIVVIIALIFPNVVKVSIIAGALSLLISWAMIYAIAGGRNVHRFMGSIVGATLGFILGLLYFGIEPVTALPIILFGAVGLLYKGKTNM